MPRDHATRRSRRARWLAVFVVFLSLGLVRGNAHAQTSPPVAPPKFEPFTFIAIGDMPYRVPQDFPRFDRLIVAMNAAKPSFSIHVGDIKSSSEPCTDEYFKTILARFQRFEHPLVYTPGDNEWTDCHRERAGRFNPRERLEKVREIFFANPAQSLGKPAMPLESQGKSMPAFAKFVENQRFWKNGVLFVTVHVVGSNNGFETTELEAVSEFFERNKANVAWIDESFRLAREQSARAVVISMQANLFDIKQKFPAMPLASGFVDTLKAIERGTKAFGRSVLVISGDEHEFEVEGLRGTDYKRIPKAWRLQVMGEQYVHGVAVTVDPSSPGVFSFAPFIVPENGPH